MHPEAMFISTHIYNILLTSSWKCDSTILEKKRCLGSYFHLFFPHMWKPSRTKMCGVLGYISHLQKALETCIQEKSTSIIPLLSFLWPILDAKKRNAAATDDDMARYILAKSSIPNHFKFFSKYPLLYYKSADETWVKVKDLLIRREYLEIFR